MTAYDIYKMLEHISADLYTYNYIFNLNCKNTKNSAEKDVDIFYIQNKIIELNKKKLILEEKLNSIILDDEIINL